MRAWKLKESVPLALVAGSVRQRPVSTARPFNEYERAERVRPLGKDKMKGQPLSPEHRAKISASRRGAIPAHGTVARYIGNRRRQPCRCTKCRKARADYVKGHRS